MKYNWDLNLIKNVIGNCINFTELLQKLNIPRRGNNSKTLRNLLDKENIDYSHFTGRARTYAKPNKKDIYYYLNDQNYIQTVKLKDRLIKEGLKENKCEICGISEWQGKKLVCQLHHKDGNNKNNNLENLQMLCPNCHSQTENFCGSANEKKHYFCKDCGKEINRNSTYCTTCAHLHRRKVERPTKEELLNSFNECKSFLAVGRKYNVSDTCVRKWCVYYDLPTKSKDLKEYIKNIT